LVNKESSYRYERKYFITDLTKHEVTSVINLNSALFSEIYHEREVNNIYFDSVNFNNYYDNLDGNIFRTKIRIRWYGDMIGNIINPILEIKRKEGLLGKKFSYPIKPFSLFERVNLEKTAEFFHESKIPNLLIEELKLLKPVLINRYVRKYYLSADHKYRITVDSIQNFYRINNFDYHLMNEIIDKNNIIVELKYNSNNDSNAQKISNNFPFRLSKSSKYVEGIKKVYFSINE